MAVHLVCFSSELCADSEKLRREPLHEGLWFPNVVCQFVALVFSDAKLDFYASYLLFSKVG